MHIASFGLHVPYDDAYVHHWDITGDVAINASLTTFPVFGSGEGSYALSTSFCEDTERSMLIIFFVLHVPTQIVPPPSTLGY